MSTSFFDNADGEAISQITALLHIFAHRNKNQHRRSVWWRHFAQFRSQLNALDHDLTRLNTTASTHVERAKLKAETPLLRSRIEQRLSSWSVARWQHAFSQLAADGRFAQLGLVLIAALAQISRLTHITSRLEGLAETEIQQVLETFGREHWQGENRSSLEDVGAAVVREKAFTSDVREASGKTPTTFDTPASIRIKSTRRKGRKHAIDELFGDL